MLRSSLLGVGERGKVAEKFPFAEEQIKQGTHGAEGEGKGEEQEGQPAGFLVFLDVEKDPEIGESEGDGEIAEDLDLGRVLKGRKDGPKAALCKIPRIEDRKADE